MPKKKVIIVGGGFAGVNLVKKLDTKFFDVIIVDKLNHHQFQPLFYQVATSQIEPSSITFPLRYMLRTKREVRVRLAKVLRINADRNSISTTIGDLEYDYLVLAPGCTTNFFGNEGMRKHALKLKSTYDAIEIRNHIHQIFEDIITSDEAGKESLMNIVIVGAGPTGIELAGAIAEIRKYTLPKDYHRIDFSKLRIILVEGSKYTLLTMSKHARSYSRKTLEKMGVEVLTEKFVENYDGVNLSLSGGMIIKTRTVVWAAGVIPNTIEGLAGQCYAKGKRMRVDRINRVDGYKNIFAIGDAAYMETENYPMGHPQLANVAINMAVNLARNLKALESGGKLREYEYRDYGTMATIGRNKAVVDLPVIRFQGFFAWMLWMFFHLMLILSVRKKLIIFINWAWAYTTRNTALTLILKKPED